jgi:hypothetical protein
VSLDPRGLVWLLIVLLGAYVIYQLLRARPQAPQQSAVEPTPGADAAPADAPVEPRERPAERLQADMLRVEMVKLREDLEARLAAQQRDIARLETELAEQRTQLERVESASKVSPQYGEAMIFARRGLAPNARPPMRCAGATAARSSPAARRSIASRTRAAAIGSASATTASSSPASDSERGSAS